jgi:hypothetical protein
LKHAPRDPDHAAVLTDLDPELHGLLLAIPAGVLRGGDESGNCDPHLAASSEMFPARIARCTVKRSRQSGKSSSILEISLADPRRDARLRRLHSGQESSRIDLLLLSAAIGIKWFF